MGPRSMGSGNGRSRRLPVPKVWTDGHEHRDPHAEPGHRRSVTRRPRPPGWNTTSAELEQVVKGIARDGGSNQPARTERDHRSRPSGEAGKGFAVVAGEVKDLAVRSAEATEAGSQIIARLQAEMREISGVMDQCVELARRKRGRARSERRSDGHDCREHGFSEPGDGDHPRGAGRPTGRLHRGDPVGSSDRGRCRNEAWSRSDRLARPPATTEARVVADCNEYMQLDIPDKVVRVAKVDHMVWRRKLATMAIGREALNPDELADHHSCTARQVVRHSRRTVTGPADAYKELADPHALVHRHGIAAARAYAAGDHETTLREIRQVGTASIDVIRLAVDKLID